MGHINPLPTLVSTYCPVYYISWTTKVDTDTPRWGQVLLRRVGCNVQYRLHSGRPNYRTRNSMLTQTWPLPDPHSVSYNRAAPAGWICDFLGVKSWEERLLFLSTPSQNSMVTLPQLFPHYKFTLLIYMANVLTQSDRLGIFDVPYLSYFSWGQMHHSCQLQSQNMVVYTSVKYNPA